VVVIPRGTRADNPDTLSLLWNYSAEPVQGRNHDPLARQVICSCWGNAWRRRSAALTVNR
ncbi:hypothetical protein, partial [Pseudomonas asplenii]|uniref:hypothetical protein n=1 Tax=Pseudomonas asplenii TaxID=53407 RepID=UPI001ED92015